MKHDLTVFLKKLNKDLNGTLLSVNIPKYVEKILKYATIVSIYKSGKLEAFIAFYENDKNQETAYLTMIAVRKECWSLGYGKTLLEFSINEIKKKAFKRYRLEVKEDNLYAINLYEKYGFIRVEAANGVVMMEKQL